MVVCGVILAFGVLFLTLFLCEKIRQYSVKETMLKAITSVLFISLATYGWYHSGGSKLAPFVIVALIFGLLGDIWLDFKYAYPNDSKIFTYAGFASFAVGHVLFIIGLYLTYYESGHFLYVLIPLLMGVVMGVVTLLIANPLKLRYGQYKKTVFFYSVLLFSMFFSAGSMLILHHWHSTTLIMFTIGGGLFAISDLILSGTYFGEDKERPIDIISNAATYYAAQFIIAFSLYFFI